MRGPRWFDRLVVALVALVVGYGAAGLALALVGWCTLPWAAVTGTVLTVALARLCWSADSGHPAVASSRWAAAAILVAIASAWVNASNAAEHVIVNRDPGVNLVAGRWVADHGTLLIDAGRGPFADADDVVLESSGTYDEGGGELQLQFTHLLPVLLAEAHWLRGDALMLIAPALIGAAALLTTYALAVRLVRRPWAAFVVTCLLAMCLPVLAAVRDTYSEGVTWLLLTGGLWLWVRAMDTSSVPIALLSGAALGAMTAARVDAVVYLVPIPAFAGLIVAAAPSDLRARRRRMVNAWIIGLVPGLGLAAIDVVLRSQEYFRDLHGEITGLWAALALSVAVGWAVRTSGARRLGDRTRTLRRWIDTRRALVATGAGAAVVVVLLLAWLVRPHVQVATGAEPSSYIGDIQAYEGVPVEPARSYAEMSLRWVGWYVGPATMVLAIGGAAIGVHRVVARRLALPSLVPWLALAGGTTLYVWRPSITPDHIWASRRFVPAVLPLVTMLAAVAAVSLVSLIGRGWPRHRALAVAAGAALALLMVVPTTTRSLPVRSLSDQRDYLRLVRDMCPQVRGGAVVAIDGERAGITLPQTLRSFCAVPAALLADDSTAAEVAQLADAWATDGCELRVLAASVDPLRELVPGVEPTRLGPYAHRALEVTVARPPGRLVDVSDVFFLVTVPARQQHGAASPCRA